MPSTRADPGRDRGRAQRAGEPRPTSGACSGNVSRTVISRVWCERRRTDPYVMEKFGAVSRFGSIAPVRLDGVAARSARVVGGALAVTLAAEAVAARRCCSATRPDALRPGAAAGRAVDARCGCWRSACCRGCVRRRAALRWCSASSAVLQLRRADASADDLRRRLPLRVGREGAVRRRRPVPVRAVGPAARPPARHRSCSGAPDHCLHRFPGGCTSINRPTVRTIYPPVAEAAFDVMRVASFGGHGGHLPLQLAGALGSLLIGWLLLRRAAAVAGRGVGVVPGGGRRVREQRAHRLAGRRCSSCSRWRARRTWVAPARWSARRSR